MTNHAQFCAKACKIKISFLNIIQYNVPLVVNYIDVLFQMYGLTWLIDLPSLVDDIDVLILLTSAICHDLGHPGYNNAYQVK